MKHSSVLSICVVTTKPNIVSLKPHHISIQFAAASDSFDIISRRPVFVKMIFKKTSRKTQKNPTREMFPCRKNLPYRSLPLSCRLKVRFDQLLASRRGVRPSLNVRDLLRVDKISARNNGSASAGVDEHELYLHPLRNYALDVDGT